MPTALLVGPAEHGVVRHGRLLAATAGWRVATVADAVPAGDVVVVEVTDRLFGPTADVSGPRLATLLDALRARRCPVVLSLHDVPSPADGAVADRRRAVYREAVRRADALVVASQVEAGRVADLGPGVPGRLAVLPLPVPCRAANRPVPARVPATSVTVLGFVYPGKGHTEVLDVVRDLAPGVPVVAAGGASDGHTDLAAELTARGLRITGWVPDTELPELLQQTTVPIAPNRVVSASASITAWWAAGRRPLTPDLPYTRELLAADPGSLLLYDHLAGPLQRALTDVSTTWLADGARPGLDVADVVAARDAAIAGWFG